MLFVNILFWGLSAILPLLFIIYIINDRKDAWIFIIIANSLPLVSALIFMREYVDYLVYAIVSNFLYIIIAFYGYLKYKNESGNFNQCDNKQMLKALLISMSLYIFCALFYYNFIIDNYVANSSMTVLDFIADILYVFSLFLLIKRCRSGLLVLAIVQALYIVYQLLSLFVVIGGITYYILTSVNILSYILGLFLLLRAYFKSLKSQAL